MQRISTLLGIIAALSAATVIAVGCEKASVGSAQMTEAAQSQKHRSVHVDSALPIEEEIRRFKATVGRSVTELEGSTDSRDALIATFVSALERADTTTLVRMALDAAEFIDLYYPHTMYTQPPYELSPPILWMLITGNSEKGLVRVLRRYAGQPFGFEAYRCDPEPKTEGPNRIWDGCVLERRIDTGVETYRMFGSIIERDGRFAFVSYANDL
jgi:hypothetical protein